MKLSLWIIKEFLKEYNPTAFIENGKKVLRGVRVLSGSNISAASTLQLVRGDNYIDSARNKVLCVHGRDMLMLETEDIDEVFNKLLDCFDYYNAWEDNCTSCIETGSGLQQLLQISQPLFSNMLLISDSKMRILNHTEPEISDDVVLTESQRKDLAYSAEILKKGHMPENEMHFLHALHRSLGAKRMSDQISVEASVSDNYSCETMTRNLSFRKNLWGILVEICHFKAPDIAEMQLLDELGSFIEAYIEANFSDDHASRYLASRLEQVFVQHRYEDLNALNLCLQDYGWDRNCRKRIYIIISMLDDISCLEELNYCLNNGMDSISVLTDHRILLLSDVDHPEFAETLLYLEENLQTHNCASAVSFVFPDIADLPLQCEIAETSLNQWLSSGTADLSGSRIIDSGAYVFRHIIRAARNASGTLFLHPAVVSLLKYDQSHNTDFTETLYQFLINDRNFAKTAQQMYLHRNTVQYRIERLAEITELDLENPETRMHVLLSLYAEKELSE